MELKLNIGIGCLACDKLIPNRFALKGKTVCSKKCLDDLRDACEKVHGKGSSGFSMADVWRS